MIAANFFNFTVSENGNHHFLKRQILAFNWRKKLSKKLGVGYR
jgi:hypothetical protein